MEDMERHCDDAARDFPELDLFMPVYRGGFGELQDIFMRSAAFFWPEGFLNITFVADAEAANSSDFVKDLERLAALRRVRKVNVRLNSLPASVFGGVGHDRQQLVMFWADNFTSAEFVGFCDDDTLFTNNVQPWDLFDEQGRPRVVGQVGRKETDRWWDNTKKRTYWAYNGTEGSQLMRTMSFFPVVVKTRHLPEMRAAMLRAHGGRYRCFDELFAVMRLHAYSQFNIMTHFLWRRHRGEYSWHLQGFGADALSFVLNQTGVEEAMTVPRVRVALHANYDDMMGGGRQRIVRDVMSKGFCYSLTKSEWLIAAYADACASAGLNRSLVESQLNRHNWVFEWKDWRWDPRVREAHLEQHWRNCRQKWDLQELRRLFPKVKDWTTKRVASNDTADNPTTTTTT